MTTCLVLHRLTPRSNLVSIMRVPMQLTTHVGDVIWAFARLVFLEQLLCSSPNKPLSTHPSRQSGVTSPSVIELLQAILEHLLLLILLHERVPLLQLIELVDHPLEEL